MAILDRGFDLEFRAVMDGEDAIVGGRASQPRYYIVKVALILIRELAWRVVVRHALRGDADGREGDAPALKLEGVRRRGLITIEPEACIGQQTVAEHGVEVAHRITRAVDAVVHDVIVRGREEIEAGAKEMAHGVRVRAEGE